MTVDLAEHVSVVTVWESVCRTSIFVVKAYRNLWSRCLTTMTSCSTSVCWTCSSYVAFATDGLMVSLLLKQLLLTVNVYFAMSHMWPHSTPHVPHLTTLHTSDTSHGTPDPSTALFPLSLQSPKRLRERADTSSPWHRCPTPLHWWRECPSILPVTTWDGGSSLLVVTVWECLYIFVVKAYRNCGAHVWPRWPPLRSIKPRLQCGSRVLGHNHKKSEFKS